MLEQDGEQFKGYLHWYQRPAFAAGIALILLFSSTLIGSYLLAKKAAEDEALKQAKIWSNSASMLVAPLILSKDLVSLNFVTNQIADDPFVAGIQITDNQSMRLAAAGEQQGIYTAKSIAPNNDSIAELEVWIDPTPVQQQLNYQTGLIGTGAVIALLLSFFIYRRQSKQLEAEVVYIQQIEDNFDLSDSVSDEFDDTQTDSLNASELDDVETRESDLARWSDSDPVDTDPTSEIDLERNTEILEDQEQVINIDSESELTEIIHETHTREMSENGVEDTQQVTDRDVPPWIDTSAPPIVKMQVDEHSDIVDLLKPERDDKVPPFVPSSYGTDHVSSDNGPSFIENEIPERDFKPLGKRPDKKAHRLPIINEEQLDLYTIEQELDLLIPAKDAGYLILIDFTSPHSLSMSRDDKQQIKRTYRTLANSVANIYSGDVEPLGEDIQIHFQEAQDRDEHGVNAACAAMLFTQLVQAYNRSRDEQSRPVLNVHTAIVRGQLNRQVRMADEARFLTRSTKSNRLISHTALSEAPDLKTTVLSNADIRREDEDKVLLLTLAKSYQELLEKQSRYLMAKLAQQAR